MKEKNKQVNLKWGMRKLSVGLCSVVVGASMIVAPIMPAYAQETIPIAARLPQDDVAASRSVSASGIGDTSLIYAGVTFQEAKGDTITLKWSKWNSAGTYWETVTDDKKDPEYFAGRYVLEFSDPEFYKQIESIEVRSGSYKVNMEKYYDKDPEKGGSLWTRKIIGGALNEGVIGANTISTVTIKLANGKTLESLGLKDKKLKFDSMWLTGKGGNTTPNLIAKESISSGYIYDKTKEKDKYPSNFSMDGFTSKAMFVEGESKKFDEIKTVHQYKPAIKYESSTPGGGYVAVIEETFPAELTDFIDWDNVYIYSSDINGNPTKNVVKTRIDKPTNGVINTFNSPAMSHKDVKTNPDVAKVRAYIQKNVLTAGAGGVGFYTISYKLKASLKDPEAAKKIIEAAKQTDNNSFLPFSSRLYADWPDNKIFGFKNDNGEPWKILENSEHNSVLDVRDTDGDGLIDFIEYQYGSNPNLVDTDGDGVPDGQEALVDNTKPNDASDYIVKAPTAENTTYNPAVENKIKGTLPKPLIKNPAKPDEDLKVTNQKAGDAIVKLHPYDAKTNTYDKDKVIAEVKIPFDKLEKGEFEMPLAANKVEDGSKAQLVAYAPNGEHPIAGLVLNFNLTDAENLTPSYKDAEGKAGVEVTTEAPTFKDADEKDVTAPNGTKYTLGDKAPEGAKIDENTGKVTYTPKESEAGKPVEIPVVITYPDKSTDNATAKVTVAKLDDVIDRTADPSKPTPAGYFRVTIDAGEGTKLANGQTKKVYDVKSGKSLTEAQYPTLEIADANNYKKPITWTVAPGTAIDKKTDIVGNATKTQAGENTPTAKAITTNINVVPEAKTGIKNAADMPEGTTYKWKTNPDVSKVTEDGKPVKATVVVTYPDKTTDEVEVAITVKDNRPDVIEQTADPSKPTPNGYFRVTIDKGEGTKFADGQTKKVYDVKSGKSLTEAQYPTLEVADANNYKKPITWTVAPGTTIDKAVDIVGKATKTQAGENTPTAKAITTDINTVPEAETGIGNKDKLPEGTTYKWKKAPDVSKVTEDGKPVKATVVVTYPDKTTDEVEVEITVKDNRPDVIDQTADPSAETPVGYHRVTFVAGDGVEALTNSPVYDVKDGVALTADKYPRATAKSGYENPVWSTPAGTAITADNATITATATKIGQTATPSITVPKVGDTEISGTSEPNAEVKVTLPNGKEVITDANNQGIWIAPLPDGTDLKENDVVKAVATVDGKTPSEEATAKTGKADAKDNEKYEPETKSVEKDKGQKPSDKEITDAVTVPNYPEDKPAPKVTIDNPIQIPDGNTPGKYEVDVTVEYPDGSKDRTTVTVTINDKKVTPTPGGTTRKPGRTREESPKRTTDRTNGKDRVETAIEISKKYFGKANTVIVVDSKDFPDAMTASVLSKLLKAPILLTNTHKLDSRVAAEIQRLGAKDVIIVGGNSSVSDAVKRELAKFDKDTVERIYGKDRYETSAQVARRVVGITGKLGHAVVASGQVFADALAVAPYASREGYPILLVKANNLPKSVKDAITELAINKVTIAGGYATVNRSLEAPLPTVVERLKGDTRYETAIDIANKKFSGSKEIFLANGVEWMDALVIGPVGGILDMPILLTRANSAPKSLKDYIAKANIQKVIAIGGTRMVSDSVLNELSK